MGSKHRIQLQNIMGMKIREGQDVRLVRYRYLVIFDQFDTAISREELLSILVGHLHMGEPWNGVRTEDLQYSCVCLSKVSSIQNFKLLMKKHMSYLFGSILCHFVVLFPYCRCTSHIFAI